MSDDISYLLIHQNVILDKKEALSSGHSFYNIQQQQQNCYYTNVLSFSLFVIIN